MIVKFITDRLGYPAARAERAWVALSSMLESELQGDFSVSSYLEDLRATLVDGTRIEFSGNAHSVVADRAMTEVTCDFDPQLPSSRIATKDLIDLILAWQSFRTCGTPMQWPAGNMMDASQIG